MICGLLGRKLSHSYSPQIHKSLGTYTYNLYEVEPEELESFLKSDDFSGLNVTIPYKKTVIPYCHRLSPCAEKLGAVNTIIRDPEGNLIGHNTDYFGFASMVARSKLQLWGKKVLVLGSGGASVTVNCVLKELGAIPIIISRSGENNYMNLDLHKDASVIVNATPVGMYPNTQVSPIDLSLFPNLEGVLDLIYNPARTKLLQDAESRGLVAQNGLWMLVAQAKESAEWFTQGQIPDSCIEKIYVQLRNEMENLILIGMPGSGKSSVGRELARLTGKTFLDADALIEEEAGKPIPEIFAENGEETFRKLETKVLSQVGMNSGLVIATGGGCVTKARNYPLLHQNGTIFWLRRDLDKLPTEGRPLSKAGHLEEMYRIREPLYTAFADKSVDNNGTVQQTCNEIITTGGTE